MPEPRRWSRLIQGRLLHVLVVYLGASWLVIEVTDTLQDVLALPEWTAAVAFVLLLSGLVVVLATAWVQSNPRLDAREASGEVPQSWDVGLGDLRRSLGEGRLPHLTWGRALVGGLVVFAAFFGFAGAYVLFRHDPDAGRTPAPAGDEPAAPAVAVAPFRISDPGLSVWEEGLVDLLSTNLDGLGALRGIDSRTMLARWSEVVGDNDRPDLPTMLSAARSTGARWALVGSVAGTAAEVRLSADIHDLGSGDKVGSAQAGGAGDRMIDLVDELSVEVAGILLGSAAAQSPIRNLSSVTTSSLPALEAYLAGEALYRRSDFRGAVERLREAVRADSTFALAWLRLHQAHGWIEEDIGGEAYVEAIARAQVLRDRLPTRLQILVRSMAALAEGRADELGKIQEATRRYPDDPELLYEAAEYYTHLEDQVSEAPLDSALSLLSRAIELDPSFGSYYIHGLDAAIWTGNPERATELLDAWRRLTPESDFLRGAVLACELVYGDDGRRQRAWQEVDSRPLPELDGISNTLRGLRHAPLREEYTRRIHARVGRANEAHVAALADQGKVRAAARYARQEGVGQREIVGALAGLKMAGVELPFDSIQVPGPADPGDPLALLARGVFAAEGDAAELDRVLAEVDARRDESAAAGDSTEARRWSHFGAALAGYAAWSAGDRKAGLAAVEAARPHITGWPGRASGGWAEPASLLRWWLGEAHAEAGHPREAAAHFRALGRRPTLLRVHARYRLAGIYEELGQLPEARRAYQDVIEVWGEADPELQAAVEDARRRLATLSGEGA